MNFELKELAIGAVLGVLTLFAFRLAGIHRERGTYAVLLAAVTAPYVIYAIETHEPDAVRHSLIALGFTSLALVGARWSLWLVALGFVGHAVFDGALHHTSLLAPTPGWYGPMCLSYNLALAMGLAGFLLQGERAADMS